MMDPYHTIGSPPLQAATSKLDAAEIKRLLFGYAKYWPLFVVCSVLALTGAYVYNLYLTPRYVTEMTIMVKNEKDGVAKEVAEGLNGASLTPGNKTLENEIEVLRSRSMAEAALRQLDFGITYTMVDKFIEKEVYANRPFTVEIDSLHPQLLNATFNVQILNKQEFLLESELEEATPFDPVQQEYVDAAVDFVPGKYRFGQYIVGSTYCFKLHPLNAASGKYKFTLRSLRGLASEYASGLSISPLNRTATILQISLEGTDPSKIIKYLNTLAQTYINKQLEEKNGVTLRTISFIDKQLETTRDSLQLVERQLQDFQSQHRLSEAGTNGNAITSKFQNLEKEKARVDLRLQYFENLEKYLERSSDPKELISPTAMGIDAPELQNLIGTLTNLYVQQQELGISAREDNPSYRSIVESIKFTKKAIRENLRYSLKLVALERQNLAKQLAQTDKEAAKLPAVERDLVNIRRQFTINETIYNFLLEKRAEFVIKAKATIAHDHKVLDSAINATKIFPNPRRNYILSMLLGLGIPLGFLFIKDYFSDKVTNLKDLQQSTRIPVLGVVPHNKYAEGVVVTRYTKSAVAEAFRTLRSGLQYLANQQQCKRILVTSLVSGEGKSFTATNLAAILSMGGKKTCLLGLDLRRPHLQEEFSEVEVKEGKGLSSYLSGLTNEHDLIVPSGIENLDLIFSGPIPRDPSELLLSSRMTKLLQYLEKFYDFIVMDTAPLGLVSDALDLITASDIVVYLVRQGYSPKQTIQELHMLQESRKLQHVYLVLNDVESKREYGYKYGKEYSVGYYEEEVGNKTRQRRHKS